MRQQLGLFLVSCLVAIGSSAAVPVVLKVTERSFQVQGGGSQPPADPQEAQLSQTDPKILTDMITQIWIEDRPEYVADSIFAAKRNFFEKRAANIQEKYAKYLEQYIENVAKNNKALVKQDGASKVYVIEDGLSFFRDFYRFEGQKDPIFRIVARSLFANPNRQSNVDSIEKLAVDLHEDSRAKTYLLSAKKYTTADLENLKQISRGNGYRFEKVGETFVFGSGISFLLTRDLVKTGLALKDPALVGDFSKILRYHEAFQIPVVHGYQQGALAYFRPDLAEMSFVRPYSADPNTYTHEMTHSRFDKFTKTLESWVKSKGYVVPFQIDGPATRGDRGGLFSLLNELNSFRMGDQFGGLDNPGTSDKEILDFIKQSYGLQAGFEATEMLDKVWTPEKVAGKSVAYLIYSEIRDFNKLSNAQLLDMGRSGIETNDMVKKMNFILMYESGRFNGDQAIEATQVFTKIGEVENEKYVAEYYEKAAKDLGLNVSEEVQKKTGSSLDLQKASFNQVFKDYSKRGSEEATALLQTKFASQLGPQHMEAFVKRAMEPPTNPYAPEGLTMIYGLLGLNRVGPVVQTKGFMMKARGVINSPMFATFDQAVAKNLFDGSNFSKRLGLLNFIVQYARPEEMPLTFEKISNLLRPNEKMAMHDVILARHVFQPPYGARGNSALWGDKLIHDPRGILLDHFMTESLIVYFKESLAPYLTPKYTYGEFASVSLDAVTRGRVIAAIKQLSPDQIQSLETASRFLWSMTSNEVPSLRTSALYALISNPMYLLMIESDIIKTVQTGDPKYAQVNKFLLDAAPGMLPKAKAAAEGIAAAQAKMTGLSKVSVELPAYEKSIFSQKLQPIGNSARVVMSCKKVLIAQ